MSKARISLNKIKFDSVNLYYQDESRFGLMTHTGKCITAMGIKPIVTYQHKFKTTYVYGSFSPIDGKSFIWEIDGVSSEIFEAYLNEFSRYYPKELKIVIIDNAGFHSTKNIIVPENIILVNIPPYSPELNPAEKVWQFLKSRFKNLLLEDINKLKQWICNTIVEKLSADRIISLTKNDFYNNAFYAAL